MNATIQTAQAAGSSVVGTVLSLSTDIFVIVGIFTALFVWGAWKGQRGLATLTISLFVAIAVFKAFPYGGVFTLAPYVPLIVFLVLLGAIYFVLMGILSVFSFEGGVGQWIKTALLTFTVMTLIVSITYHVVLIAPIYHWSGAVDFLFKSDQLFFWWLVAPLIVLFFI